MKTINMLFYFWRITGSPVELGLMRSVQHFTWIILAALLFSQPSLHAQSVYATPYTFTTFAGSAEMQGRTDGTGSAARFNNPSGIAVDSAGNVYVADTANATIRKITPGGVVSTLAGNPGVPGYQNGTGSGAEFYYPHGLAVDTAGNVYVADSTTETIREVSPGGVVTTLAGTLGVSGSNDGTGTAARFKNPYGVAVDGNGTVYVADDGNYTIRKITSGGVVTTIAGTAGVSGTNDGTGSAAQFEAPSSIAVDTSGNLYATDSGDYTIRKITPGGVVTTLAGNIGFSGYFNGDADGTGAAAEFYNPVGIAVDASGYVYVTDTLNCTVRKITPAGVVTTLAGMASNLGGDIGSSDGTGSAALFNSPSAIAVDSSGNLYVADSENDTVRKGTPPGGGSGGSSPGNLIFTTLAGSGNPLGSGSTDGAGGAALFDHPTSVAVDGNGNAYVADQGNDTIRKITAGGVVTTFAGSAGNPGSNNGTGGAARFNQPTGVAVDSSGNVYVADTNNSTIREITPAGVVTTLAGIPGTTGDNNGMASAATFTNPTGLAVDSSGNIYVADDQDYLIRKITSGGIVSTLAGTYNSRTDGSGSTSDAFFYPTGVAVDSSGNVYVADSENDNIRKITPGGSVSTLAGNFLTTGSTNGTGTAALFFHPTGVAVDSSGNVYVADDYNCDIRLVTSGGVVTTLAGLAGTPGTANGAGSVARFYDPYGVAVDSHGNVYIADTGNNSIRKGSVQASGPPNLYFQNSNLLGYLSLNTTFLPSAWLGLGSLGSGWQEQAIGDINGDGTPDIIFQNGTQIGAVILNESGNPTSWVGIGQMGAGWELRGAGDLTDDGNLDLIFQNGTLLGYLEVNTSGQPVSWNGIGAMGTGWELRAVASLDGTGQPDLIFQNGTVLGALQVSTSGVPTAWTGIGAMGAGWTLSYALDVAGTGQPDLIFQNGTLIGALQVNTLFQPVTWYGVGAMGSGWTLPGDY
jgi:hypothetical protein